MYLVLDLLYNVNNYVFPLFYYRNNDEFEVYSPITKRSVYKCGIIYYYNYKKFDKPPEKITIEELDFGRFSFHKCEPFKLSREEIDFLENKIN